MGWRTRQLPENVSLVYRFQFILIWTGVEVSYMEEIKRDHLRIIISLMRFRSKVTLSLAQVHL